MKGEATRTEGVDGDGAWLSRAGDGGMVSKANAFISSLKEAMVASTKERSGGEVKRRRLKVDGLALVKGDARLAGGRRGTEQGILVVGEFMNELVWGEVGGGKDVLADRTGWTGALDRDKKTLPDTICPAAVSLAVACVWPRRRNSAHARFCVYACAGCEVGTSTGPKT